MTEREVVQVENALGVELPETYRRWLLALPSEITGKLQVGYGCVFDTPEAILKANLGLIDSDWLEGTEWSDMELCDFVAIGGDGCGNYFIIDPDDDKSAVQLLSHDPVGIEDAFPSIDAFCESVSQAIRG